ncbi:MAG TPA: hypothetical protein VF179_17940 [Thermoanaerobaculia bacterium]|nr:hypothetical protein [Thermoanaerobaculia bacterium]
MSDKANETTTQTETGSGSGVGMRVPDIPIGSEEAAIIRGTEEPPKDPPGPGPVPGGGKSAVKPV